MVKTSGFRGTQRKNRYTVETVDGATVSVLEAPQTVTATFSPLVYVLEAVLVCDTGCVFRKLRLQYDGARIAFRKSRSSHGVTIPHQLVY